MISPALYDWKMLSLTRREQIVLVLLLVSLLAGAGIRHLRMIHQLPEDFPPSVSQLSQTH